MQTVMAIWILDEDKGASPHAIYASIFGVLCVLGDALYFKRIHDRFFGSGTCAKGCCKISSVSNAKQTGSERRMSAPLLTVARGSESTEPRLMSDSTVASAVDRRGTNAPDTGVGSDSSGAAGRRGSVSVLDNPLTRIHDNPDAAAAVNRNSVSIAAATASIEWFHSGILLKRSLQPGEGRGSRLGTGLKRLAQTVGGEWRERFFVLSDGRLNYWKSEADYNANKPPELDSRSPIDLAC